MLYKIMVNKGPEFKKEIVKFLKKYKIPRI